MLCKSAPVPCMLSNKVMVFYRELSVDGLCINTVCITSCRSDTCFKLTTLLTDVVNTALYLSHIDRCLASLVFMLTYQSGVCLVQLAGFRKFAAHYMYAEATGKAKEGSWRMNRAPYSPAVHLMAEAQIDNPGLHACLSCLGSGCTSGVM